MKTAIAFALAALAGVAQAVNFTTLFTGQTLTKGSVVELDWTTVDTDPSTMSIYLVNFVQWPPLTYSLAEDLQTSAGSAYVRIPCDVDSTSGYQFNAINGTNTYVIYAQTGVFSLTGNCTNPPATSTVETVTVHATPVEICRPKKTVIFDIQDTIWFVPHHQNQVRTCDATVTETLLAKEVTVVTETVAASTVTVTVVAGSGCPVSPVPKPSYPPAPASSAVPVTHPSKAPYPIPSSIKPVNVTKPTVVFTSGAESSVRNTIVFAAGLAVIAALVL